MTTDPKNNENQEKIAENELTDEQTEQVAGGKTKWDGTGGSQQIDGTEGITTQTEV